MVLKQHNTLKTFIVQRSYTPTLVINNGD